MACGYSPAENPVSGLHDLMRRHIKLHVQQMFRTSWQESNIQGLGAVANVFKSIGVSHPMPSWNNHWKWRLHPEISGLSAERPQSQWSTHIVLWFEWNYHYDVSNISNTGQCWLVECLPGCWYNIHDFTPLIASLEFYTKHYCHTPYTNSDGDRRWSFSSI